MPAEREADASDGEVEARVDVVGIIICQPDIVERAVKVRQSVCICTESIDEILAGKEKVVTVAEEVAVAVGGIQQIVPVDVGVVVGC